MAISKINSVNIFKSNNTATETKNTNHTPIKNNITKASKIVSIPVAILMSMHPSLLNAQNNNDGKKYIDSSQKYVEQMLNGDNFQEYDFNLPFNLQELFLVDVEQFKINNKPYTMYFTDFGKTSDYPENSITGIYIVPDNYSTVMLEAEELSAPPKLEKLLLHNTGKKYFYSAIVSEILYNDITNKQELLTKELRLPYNIGQKLEKLLNGESDFVLPNNYNVEFEEVFGKDLMQPHIEILQDITTNP